MSTSEIIEEIKKLPSEEQQKIAVYLGQITIDGVGKDQAGVSKEFEGMAEEIFRTNDKLFRKLAQ